MSAADRVERYLEVHATLGGIDHELLHTVHAAGAPAELLASDLRSLVRGARQLEVTRGLRAPCLNVLGDALNCWDAGLPTHLRCESCR